MIIVTGIPRSGTSLMMQILFASNIPVFVDEFNRVDDGNTKGYYEHSLVCFKDNSWIHQASDKAVKVIVDWLEFLPQNLSYKIIVMRRSLGEVAISRKYSIDDAIHQNHILNKWLFDKDYCEVYYEDLLNKTIDTLQHLKKYITEINVDLSSLVIDKSLWRSKI